jgi:hypothetical protein
MTSIIDGIRKDRHPESANQARLEGRLLVIQRPIALTKKCHSEPPTAVNAPLTRDRLC